MIREYCMENISDLEHNIDKPFERIECCHRLDLGGLTPDWKDLEKAIMLCHAHDKQVMTMIRCRTGNFIYSKQEKIQMLKAIDQAIVSGTDGIVIGALKDGGIDEAFLKAVCVKCHNEKVGLTFHMAFGDIPEHKQFQAIDQLVALGFQRLLTHGGPLDQPIEETVKRIQTLADYANDRLIILPGGGITTDNIDSIHQKYTFKEYHGTRLI